MLSYALKGLLHRPARSILLVFGIALLVTMVIVITGIVDYQIVTMNRHASAAAGKVFFQPAVSGTAYPPQGLYMEESAALSLMGLPGLQENLCSPLAFLTLEAPRFPNEPPALLLTGLLPGHEEAFTGSISNDVKPASGTEFLPGTGHAVILGASAAARLTASTGGSPVAGGSIDILGARFIVAGILAKSADMVVNNSCIVALSEAQDLLGVRGMVSSVVIVPERVGGEKLIIDEALARDPRLIAITDESVRENLHAGIALFESMVRSISVMDIVAASLLISLVLYMSIRGRYRELGILMAGGFTRRSILLIVFLEILGLTAAGFAAGAGAASLLLRFCMMENIFAPARILRWIPMVPILSAASLLIPGLSLRRISPIDALRYE